jgi:ceramide glucosyltransferase
MQSEVFQFLEYLCLIPVIGGSVYAVLCVLTAIWFRVRKRPVPAAFRDWPAVSILKPVHGLEKNQRENLRSTCLQDYPEFQVVFSVQETGDPAIPLLREIQREFGPDRVTVVIDNRRPGTNGKINNMSGGLPHARHGILVISDSDVRLKPDYLKTVVAPLADPKTGCVCTLYKAACAEAWFEKMELLSLNADFMPSVIFADVTGASNFCLGASAALRRTTLDEIGGLEGLADYLVEDYEMGRRIWTAGKKIAVLPYLVDTMVDLKSPFQWWGHQVYWDQNTRAARPGAFFATVLIRSVPFALLYTALRRFDAIGIAVLAGSVAIRLLSAGCIMGWVLRDREGLRNLPFLVIRDLAALGSWMLAFTKRTTVWRGAEFILTRDGRLVARGTQP